jgi:uncharacterized protein YbaA (DUF1428 family)
VKDDFSANFKYAKTSKPEDVPFGIFEEGRIETMKKYVDGYVLALPKKNLRTYRQMAEKAGKVWRKHGALEYFECVGDDLNTKWAGIKFPRTVRAKPGETVVFSFVVFKSRAHRDRVNAKVMKELMSDPACGDKPMPFDMKRMVYGGFKVLVEA